VFPHTAIGYNAKPASMYYVRLQVISSCGTITESNLEMTPSDEEFRTERFNAVKVTGYSNKNFGGKDIDSSAKHDAISRLLSQYGLKSISSKRKIVDFKTTDITIMNYEGAIRYPFSVLNRGYVKNGSTYRVVMEADFAPIALPSEWDYLHLKARIKQSFKDVCSLFYRDFP
jgi:hypothetical protein